MNIRNLYVEKYIWICKIQICPNLSRFFWIFLEKKYPDLLVSNFIQIYLDLFGKNISGFISFQFHPNLSRFFWIFLEKKYPDLLVSNFIQIYLDFFGFIWKKNIRIYYFPISSKFI